MRADKDVPLHKFVTRLLYTARMRYVIHFIYSIFVRFAEFISGMADMSLKLRFRDVPIKMSLKFRLLVRNWAHTQARK